MKKINELLLGVLVLLGTSVALGETYAVVLNPGNKFSGDPKGFFLLKAGSDTWPSGTKVVPFDVQSKTDIKVALARTAFLKQVLGFSSAGDYDEYWIQQKSKGQTRRPASVDNFDAVLRNVAREAGGIGIAPKGAAQRKGLKIVKTFDVN